MTHEDRAALAEQLLSNPLYVELHDELEKDAIEAMISASDDETRAICAMRVTAIRTLRTDCERQLRNTHKRKAAPA